MTESKQNLGGLILGVVIGFAVALSYGGIGSAVGAIIVAYCAFKAGATMQKMVKESI
ncbi:Uncharacterised protein [uncultured archaeon]|nr:Uncharacterised protein [uncultured archaeon]